jgi:lipoprotein-anchoring transpeptidase ErfK/SrfK
MPVRRVAAGVAAGLVVLVAVLVAGARTPDERAADPPATTSTTDARRPPSTTSPVPVTLPGGHPESITVADATVPKVQLFDAPDVVSLTSGFPTEQEGVLDNPTWEKLPVVFLVKEIRPNWVHVAVSTRPNGRMAWVRASDVTIRSVPNWIRVELGNRKATVYHGAAVVMETPVAVGTDAAPTPTGSYFVDGALKLRNPNGEYGAYQLSISAFSDIFQRFGSGVGQIALHGTNRPDLLGQAVSHGCVRFSNEAITQMVELAPLGTPVEIVA